MFGIKYKPSVIECKERADGSKEWYLNGKLHRVDGPAVERADGTKWWCLNDKLHREDGPAVESSTGDKYWYLNGKRHREDGPAIEYANGDKIWYLNGKEYWLNEFLNNTPISRDEKIILKLTYGHIT